MEILLNSYKNIKSVNVDNYEKIELSNKPSLNNEYDIRNVLSVTEIFDAEREASQVYRIYGKIEYLSMLNGLKSFYVNFSDFFIPLTSNCKDIFNSFDFYLVRPAVSGYSSITNESTNYVRYFQVVATPDDFEIFSAGFSNSVFGEQSYSFNFNKDFDVSPYLDKFGFPLTELFLYAQYKPSASPLETMSATTWSTTTGVSSKFVFNPIPPNTSASMQVGDYLESVFFTKIGDKVGYSKSEFYQTQLTPQTFYIRTPYIDGYSTKYLVWKYNPFIPFRLRYFNNEVSRGNTGSTSYDLVSSIPYYATPVDDKGNYVWRDILPQGFTDPITNLGVDYPFVNKCRYLFSPIILDIVPDLSDANTYEAFKNIWFSRYAQPYSITPLGDINDIGKPCK